MNSRDPQDLTIRDIREQDAGEVLTLQRAAFVQEALIYDTVRMPPLTQNLQELKAELSVNLGLVAVLGSRIVGAVRARRKDDLLLIGRLVIAPDVQGLGIGSRLLRAVEDRGRAAGCRQAELFTGSLSEANLRLYVGLGYHETQRVEGDDGVEQVFLRTSLVDPHRPVPPGSGDAFPVPPAQRLSDLARERSLTIAVAESLTCGLLATEIGKGEDAADWFAGGIVAYQPHVKVRALGVTDGLDPCSAECAGQLARGVRALLRADIAVATTGVGGPDSENGHPPGTVFVGWSDAAGSGAERLQLAGGPDDVLRATVDHAVRRLVDLAADAG